MLKTFLIAGAALALSATVALAQPKCNERDKVLNLLAKKYQEIPVGIGITNTGGLVEVLTDAKGRTWTIIVTTPDGISCLVAAGEDWEWIPTPHDGSKLDPKI